MLAGHRCHKGVTSAGIVGDVPPARAAVAKRFAQRRDMDPECTVVDDRIGPRAGDEPILVDRLAGAFEQRDQNIESVAAGAQRLRSSSSSRCAEISWNDPKTKVSSYTLESS